MASPAVVPPQLYFIVSAVFHYLGPAFAVLLFARVEVLGVAWLRICSAAVLFALWRRPWRSLRRLDRAGARGPVKHARRARCRRRAVQRDACATPILDRPSTTLLAWGAVLAVMNCCFYLAIERLPLGTVAAVEFLPVIALAAVGARTLRNGLALAVAVAGVWLLTDVRLEGEPLGVALAFANAVLFAGYVVLGHRVARQRRAGGIDGLAAAMLVAAVLVTPVAGASAAPVLLDPVALAAGVGVGVSSSVIPYVTDQLAMARLPRASYALLVSLLPATATVVGVVVLAQVPTAAEGAGVALVVAGVAAHRQPREQRPPEPLRPAGRPGRRGSS
jgi:inner membrane transporter RhtA